MKFRILTVAAMSALALAACNNNADKEDAATDTAMEAESADGAMSATDSGSNASTSTSSGGSGGGAAAAGSSGGQSGSGGAMSSSSATPQIEVTPTPVDPNSLRNTSNEQVRNGPVAPGTPPTLPPGQGASTNPQ